MLTGPSNPQLSPSAAAPAAWRADRKRAAGLPACLQGTPDPPGPPQTRRPSLKSPYPVPPLRQMAYLHRGPIASAETAASSRSPPALPSPWGASQRRGGVSGRSSRRSRAYAAPGSPALTGGRPAHLHAPCTQQLFQDRVCMLSRPRALGQATLCLEGLPHVPPSTLRGDSPLRQPCHARGSPSGSGSARALTCHLRPAGSSCHRVFVQCCLPPRGAVATWLPRVLRAQSSARRTPAAQGGGWWGRAAPWGGRCAKGTAGTPD